MRVRRSPLSRCLRGALAPAAALPVLVLACARPIAPPPALPVPAVRAESTVARRVAPGVVHRAYTIARGPWTVHVLDVDQRACWTPAALKPALAAAGRATVLSLTQALAVGGDRRVAGAVNADFFSLTAPTGVPTGAHVQSGVVIAGPGVRPVFAVDAGGRVHLGVLHARGTIESGRDTIAVDAWNRGSPRVAMFDANWGVRTDSAPGRLFVRLRGSRASLGDAAWAAVIAVRDSADVAAIGAGEWVIAAGASTPHDTRARLRTLRPGVDSVRVAMRLDPVQPREAVGGHPMLVRDGRVLPDVDSAGNAGFRGVNPRTAVGVGDAGRRLFLVTVDGRQPGFSVGISLRDLAELMRELGATDALNLDGGGSTTFVVADSVGAALRVANRPSDAQGPRAVGNALGIVRGCAGSAAP